MEEVIYSVFMDLPILILLIIIGISLYVLSKGADILVNEAVNLSLSWGIPQMIVGATIVSLGTTLPETTVSVAAALKGNPDLALGNAIGSIITNTSLIIGTSALIGSISIDRTLIKTHGRVQLMAAILLSIVSLPFFSKGSNGLISQGMGFVFIAFLLVYVMGIIKNSKDSDAVVTSDFTGESSPMFMQLIKLILGIILIVGSSKILIPSVEITALSIGIPQSVIAATLVAFGTSLPELVTAITAVRKGHGDLAIGNVIGANILNVLLVVGASAAVTKTGLMVPINFYKLQIPAMLIALITFHIFSNRKNNMISKPEGIVLTGIYVIYLVLNYIWV